MKEVLNKITISEQEYPVKFDHYVLSRVQEEFESIDAFEQAILWFAAKTDQEGNVIKEDGDIVWINKEPNVKVMNFVLPLIINEGLEIEAEEFGIPFTPVTQKDVIRNLDIPFRTLAKLIHAEYRRCFASKKYNPGKADQTEKAN